MPAAARTSAPSAPRPAARPASAPAAGSPAPGASAQVAGGPAITIGSDAEKDPRFKKVKDELEKDARKNKTHPPARSKSDQAQAAAVPPPNARLAGAKANQVDAMKEAPTPKPEPNAFLTMLRAAIQQVMPQNLDQADKFMKGGEPEKIKDAVTGGVAQEKDAATGGVQAATQQAPDPSKVPDREVKPIPPDGAAPAPPAINPADTVPLPKPDARVEATKQAKADADQQLKDAEVTPDQLKKANDPRFSAVLGAKSAVDKKADAGPAQYRAKEKGALTQTAAQAQGEASKGLAALRGIRGKTQGGVKSGQLTAKEKEQAEEAKDAAKISGIYEQTKAAVEAKLANLETTVLALFDRGIEAALANLKSYSEQEIDRYKDERYSGIRGKARWIADLFGPVPEGIKRILEQARVRFLAQMDALVVRIADTVESRLREAKAEIDKGQSAIKAYVATLKGDRKNRAQATADKFNEQFDALREGVDAKANDLAQKLAQKYKEASDKANAALKEIEDANKGALRGLAEAIGEVVKALLEFKAKLMALFKKGADTIKLILADPIGFLSNLIAAVKLGFNQFVSNIWAHLKAGFMAWLFGSLAEAGIQIPTDLSLPSILKLVLDLLGINYATLRSIAVKHLGERAVQIIEKVAEYIMTLIRGGPAALWEKVKEDLSNLKAMVIDALQSWLIETVVKQAVMKVLSMLNPAGAIVQAIIAIYNTVMFLVERASQIMALVEAVINSVSAIASGAIGGAANWIEQALARAIPVVIGFLARLIGLGGISTKIRETIAKAQAVVYKAMEKAVVKIIDVVKKTIGRLLGKGKDKDKDKPDDRTDDQKKQDLHKGVTEADELLRDPKLSAAGVRKKLPAIKAKYKMTSLEVVTDGTTATEEKDHIRGSVNPDEDGPPETKVVRMALVPLTFKRKPKYDTMAAEYARQVKGQEAGLNAMLVSAWSANRTAYLNRAATSESGSGRDERAASAQAAFRDQKRAELVIKKVNELTAKGVAAAAARSQAVKEVDAFMETQAALHDPDQIAGGDPTKIRELGNRRINSSIGSQWKAQVLLLDAAVKPIPEETRKDLHMNVRMDVVPG